MAICSGISWLLGCNCTWCTTWTKGRNHVGSTQIAATSSCWTTSHTCLEVSSTMYSEDFHWLIIVGCAYSQSIPLYHLRTQCHECIHRYVLQLVFFKWCWRTHRVEWHLLQQKHVSPRFTRHWQKFGKVEDAINWQNKEFIINPKMETLKQKCYCVCLIVLLNNFFVY